MNINKNKEDKTFKQEKARDNIIIQGTSKDATEFVFYWPSTSRHTAYA